MFGGQRMDASLFFVLLLCFPLTTTVSTSNETKDQSNPTSTVSSTSSPTTRSIKDENITKCKNATGETGCGKCVQGHTGERCDECANGWHRNSTNPNSTCKQCNCSGNLDLQQTDSCHPVTGVCQKCLPNTSGLYCEKCTEGFHGDAVIAKNCIPVVSSVSHRNKELVIIIICSVVAAFCLVGIAAFLYRFRKRRCRKEGGMFWKVELSNRNYDNLDFSLLDPVTDTPLVFRADIAGFDDDALLASEKPQLILETEEDIIG